VATIDWPDELPQEFVRDGYSEALPDNLLRDNFDMGPASVRPRQTAAPFRVSGKMVMTTTQWGEFKDFCEDVIIQRSLPFGFPAAGDCGGSPTEEWLVRIVEPPTRMPSPVEGEWDVALVLEVLPQ